MGLGEYMTAREEGRSGIIKNELQIFLALEAGGMYIKKE